MHKLQPECGQLGYVQAGPGVCEHVFVVSHSSQLRCMLPSSTRPQHMDQAVCLCVCV